MSARALGRILSRIGAAPSLTQSWVLGLCIGIGLGVDPGMANVEDAAVSTFATPDFVVVERGVAWSDYGDGTQRLHGAVVYATRCRSEHAVCSARYSDPGDVRCGPDGGVYPFTEALRAVFRVHGREYVDGGGLVVSDSLFY